jgi:hypothetical protein
MAGVPDVLPPELITRSYPILTQPTSKDLHTLTACSVISLIFSAASRAVLFHPICISPHLTVHGFYERSARDDDTIIGLESILSISRQLSVQAGSNLHAALDAIDYATVTPGE